MTDKLIIKTSWEEVTLGEFLKISKVEMNKNLKKSAVKKSLKLAAIISNKTEKEIGQMSQEMFLTILEKISFLYNTDLPKGNDKPFNIDGHSYIFHPNFDKLSAGEMVSIEQLITEASDSKRNFLPDILSVLIRPCTTKKRIFSKKPEYIIEPFDAENLEFRKNLFLKELLVPNFLTRVEAFTNGAKRFNLITSLSSVRRNQLKNQLTELSSLLKNENPSL